MSDIERYRIIAISPDAAGVAKHPNGEWVSHEDAAAEIAKMRPVYEAAMKWHNSPWVGEWDPAEDALHGAVVAALAADRDREVKGE